MATSVVNPRAQFFANNGRPLIGGRIHTYVAGSSTRARTYKDAAKAQPNTNPIILDGRGEAQIYLAEGVEYKFVVEDSKGVMIYTQEPVYGAVWPNAAEWPSDATLSYQYMTEAKAAAETIGPIKFYDTHAQAQGDIDSLQPGDIVEIAQDETAGGARTRYRLQSGALAFIVNLDQVRLDLARPNGPPITTGAAMIAWLRSSARAVATTAAKWLQWQPVSVMEFMTDAQRADAISATPSMDMTAAVQAALDSLPARGGKLRFPDGVFSINSVTCNKPVTIEGGGPRCSVIRSTSPTGDVFTLTGSGSGVKDIGFTASVTRTSGAFVKLSSAWKSSVNNVEFQKYFIGLDVDNVAGCTIQTINALDGVGSAQAAGGAIIRVGETAYCGGINISDLVADVNDTSKQPSNGILLRYVDVVTIDGALIIHHGNNLTIEPKSGQFAALVKVTDSDFDTAVRGALIHPQTGGRVTRCTFAQTWFGANSMHGIEINGAEGSVDGVHFSGVLAHANGQIGVNALGAGVKNATFSNSSAAGNGGNGLQLTSGASVRWDGGCLGATDELPGNGSNGAGIGTGSSGSLTNAKMDGNTLGPISNLSAATFITAGNTPYEWEFYSTPVTSLSGGLGSATCAVKVKRFYKTAVFSAIITINDNGSGADAIFAGLPFTSALGNNAVAAGRETSNTGKMVQGLIDSGANRMYVVNFDGSYPGGTGARIVITGTYEIQ